MPQVYPKDTVPSHFLGSASKGASNAATNNEHTHAHKHTHTHPCMHAHLLLYDDELGGGGDQA